jgi:predicted transcriptional regulator
MVKTKRPYSARTITFLKQYSFSPRRNVDVIKATGLDIKNPHRTIACLNSFGLIIKVRKGLYAITPKGLEVLKKVNDYNKQSGLSLID